MATVLEVCTTEGLRSVERFLREKGLNAKEVHKEMFYVYGGKCLSVKQFTAGSRNSLNEVRKS
jgi:hypothetical protein